MFNYCADGFIFFVLVNSCLESSGKFISFIQDLEHTFTDVMRIIFVNTSQVMFPSGSVSWGVLSCLINAYIKFFQ